MTQLIERNPSEMSNDSIKMIVDTELTVIKNATRIIEQMREACPHEHTHTGKYSWRVGVIQDAEICDYCGKMIKIIDYPL